MIVKIHGTELMLVDWYQIQQFSDLSTYFYCDPILN